MPLKVIRSIREVLTELRQLRCGLHAWKKEEDVLQELREWIIQSRKKLPGYGMVEVRGSPPFYGTIKELAYQDGQLKVIIQWARDGTIRKFVSSFNGKNDGEILTIIIKGN